MQTLKRYIINVESNLCGIQTMLITPLYYPIHSTKYIHTNVYMLLQGVYIKKTEEI